MIRHIYLGKTIGDRQKALSVLIRNGIITLGGHRKLKIYGLLNCTSGKRMKVENRVKNEAEALRNGYRPCGHCLNEKYKQWKYHPMVNNSESEI